MALSASNFEIRSTATASNVNGGGFNPANANMLTNLAGTTATGNSPVVTSASYNFVAGDVGAWLYVKSGTNWTPGWYQIASVAANAATLSATIGAAVQVVNNLYIGNTAAGCATTASPTGGTFTIDYSQQNAGQISITDAVSVGSSTTMTSVSALFTPVMVGNLFHLNNAGTGGFGTVGWYEIISYNSTSSVVTDRTTNSGTAMALGQGIVGGALSLGSSDDAVFELAISSATSASRYFIKGGSAITYTVGGTVSIAAAGNAAWPIIVEAYAALRGDRPTGATRPTLNLGATQLSWGSNWDKYSLISTGTAATVESGGTNGKSIDCKCFNSSTTAARAAYGPTSTYTFLRCEAISERGIGISCATQTVIIDACYVHDSDVGIALSTGSFFITDCIVSNNATTAISVTGANVGAKIILNNTLYGAENIRGTGLLLASGTTNLRFINNIVYGFTTGVSHADTQTVCYDDYNDYFNNTADVSSAAQWQKGPHDIAVNPSFTNVAQLTGTTATTSGSILTQAAGDFSSVTDNVDFVYIVSGTGVTAGKYLITSHTGTTITLNSAPGTSAVADKVWSVTTNHNFAVAVGLKASGTPGIFPAGLTTGYIDVGGAQRQEPTVTNTGTTTSYAYV